MCVCVCLRAPALTIIYLVSHMHRVYLVSHSLVCLREVFAVRGPVLQKLNLVSAVYIPSLVPSRATRTRISTSTWQVDRGYFQLLRLGWPNAAPGIFFAARRGAAGSTRYHGIYVPARAAWHASCNSYS